MHLCLYFCLIKYIQQYIFLTIYAHFIYISLLILVNGGVKTDTHLINAQREVVSVNVTYNIACLIECRLQKSIITLLLYSGDCAIVTLFTEYF